MFTIGSCQLLRKTLYGGYFWRITKFPLQGGTIRKKLQKIRLGFDKYIYLLINVKC